MNKRIVSFVLSGTMILGTSGQLIPPASAVESVPNSQNNIAQSSTGEVSQPMSTTSVETTPTTTAPSTTQATATQSTQNLSISPDVLWLQSQEQIQLTAALSSEIANQPIIWTCSDPTVCVIGEDGTVTAMENGSAILTAQVGALSATCTVYVGLAAPILSGITLNANQQAVLTWPAVDGCDGYRVYRRASAEADWEALETLTNTEWTDTSMSVEEGYSYAVRAYKLRGEQPDDGSTIWSEYAAADVPVFETYSSINLQSAAAKPAAPKLVSAKSVSTGKNQVTWQTVSNIDGYRVYRKVGDSWKLLRIINDASATNYIDSGITAGSTYTYTVRAFSSNDGKIVLSDFDTNGVTVTAASVAAPSTPALGTVTSGGYDRLNVSWSASSNAEGYYIYRKTSATERWQYVGEVSGANTVSYTDTTANCGTTYLYTVRAYRTASGKKIYSGYDDKGISGTAVPSTPALKAASVVSSSSIKVSWGSVSGADGYRVYRKTSASGSWEYVAYTTGQNATSYTDTGLTGGTTYYYTVSAFHRLSSSSFSIGSYNSTGVNATTTMDAAIAPSTPKLGKVTSGGYDRLNITWGASTDAEGYYVYRRTSAASKWQYVGEVSGANTTTYTDATVACGTTYFYTARAYRTVNGKKVYSGYDDKGISGTAVPATPALKGASAVSSSSIKVSWSPVSGADGYRVYRKTSASGSWEYVTYTTGQNATSYTDTGLTSGKTYYYTVSAFHRLSSSSFSIGSYNTTGVSATTNSATTAYSNVYATYSTSYSASNKNRTTNLNIACTTINGTIIKPGGSFSFNGILGKRTSSKGYKPATIFTGGSGTAQELGGGICQVASTMFNTALLANVQITERSPHSQKVAYVPLGRDAGIYYGSKDFKFKNNTNYNIKIKSWISGGTLTVQFLTTEKVSPASVNLSVTQSGGTYTLKRSVNGTVNYTTKSTYG